MQKVALASLLEMKKEMKFCQDHTIKWVYEEYLTKMELEEL